MPDAPVVAQSALDEFGAKLMDLNPTLTEEMRSNCADLLAQGARPEELSLVVHRMPVKPEKRVGPSISILNFDPLAIARDFGNGDYWARVRGPSKYKGGAGYCPFGAEVARPSSPAPAMPAQALPPSPQPQQVGTKEDSSFKDMLLKQLVDKVLGATTDPVKPVDAVTQAVSQAVSAAEGVKKLRDMLIGGEEREQQQQQRQAPSGGGGGAGGIWPWLGQLVRDLNKEWGPTIRTVIMEKLRENTDSSGAAPGGNGYAGSARPSASGPAHAQGRGGSSSGGGGPGGGSGVAAGAPDAEAHGVIDGEVIDPGATVRTGDAEAAKGSLSADDLETQLGKFGDLLMVGAMADSNAELYACVLSDAVEVMGVEASHYYLTHKPADIVGVWLKTTPLLGGFTEWLSEVESAAREKIASLGTTTGDPDDEGQRTGDSQGPGDAQGD